MLKPRKFTLRTFREALKVAGRPVSDAELAAAVGCAESTIRDHLYLWVQKAAGVKSVRRGAKQYVGWSYVAPETEEDLGGYEPVTLSVEQLEVRVLELEAEVAALRATGSASAATPR
jgi:hypothetical protein